MYGANNVDSVFRFLKKKENFYCVDFINLHREAEKLTTTTTTTTEKFLSFLVVEVEVVHTTTTEIVSRKTKTTHTHMAISLFNATLPTWLMNYYPDTGKRLKRALH